MSKYSISGKVQSISGDDNEATVVLDSSATGGLPAEGTDGPLDNYFYYPDNMNAEQLQEFKRVEKSGLGITIIFDGARKVLAIVDPVDRLTPQEKAKVAELEKKYTRDEILARLKADLQVAVEIELSTLPIYLYTYYSIIRQPGVFASKSGTDLNLFANKAGGVIMSVAVEEMLHMTLAANILYALGEEPKMYGKSPNFKSEPGGTNLPHHKPTGPDGKPVAIPLANLSYETLWGFLEIEYPEAKGEPLVDDNWSTIGGIYSFIRCLIATKHVQDSDFTAGAQNEQIPDAYYGPSNIDTIYADDNFDGSAVPMAANSAASVAQYPNSSDSHAGMFELITVHDKLTAFEAISTICDQGEGFGGASQELPTDDPSKTEESHYYKFLSLQSELTPYGAHHEVLPKAPVPPPPAAQQWTPDNLKSITHNYPVNPITENYEPQVRALSNLCNAVYQYMFLMTEATYGVSGTAQEKLFNVDMHKAMIWILDKLIPGMSGFTVSIHVGGPDSVAEESVVLAPTFENIDITSNGLSPKANIQVYLEEIATQAALENVEQANKPNSYTRQMKMLNGYEIPGLIADLEDVSQPPTGFVEISANEAKHSCMGLNACKGQGAKIGGFENNCAGEGLCSTANTHRCHTLNDCKHQGGCGLYGTTLEQSQPGGNECKGQGSCAAPINAERFATADGVRGESVWQLARKAFEARMKAEGKTFNDPPPEAYVSVNDESTAVGPTGKWLRDEGISHTACGSSGMSGGGSCS